MKLWLIMSYRKEHANPHWVEGVFGDSDDLDAKVQAIADEIGHPVSKLPVDLDERIPDPPPGKEQDWPPEWKSFYPTPRQEATP